MFNVFTSLLLHRPIRPTVLLACTFWSVSSQMTVRESAKLFHYTTFVHLPMSFHDLGKRQIPIWQVTLVTTYQASSGWISIGIRSFITCCLSINYYGLYTDMFIICTVQLCPGLTSPMSSLLLELCQVATSSDWVNSRQQATSLWPQCLLDR